MLCLATGQHKQSGLWCNLVIIGGSGPPDRGSNPRSPIFFNTFLYNLHYKIDIRMCQRLDDVLKGTEIFAVHKWVESERNGFNVGDDALKTIVSTSDYEGFREYYCGTKCPNRLLCLDALRYLTEDQKIPGLYLG